MRLNRLLYGCYHKRTFVHIFVGKDRVFSVKTTYGSNSTKIGEFAELRTKIGELWC